MRFICTFSILVLLLNSLSAQSERFVHAGLRFFDLPEQTFVDDFNEIYNILDFKSRPSLKMGGGVKHYIAKRAYLDLEITYSINPFSYFKDRQRGEGTQASPLVFERFDYGGYIGLMELATHTGYVWGKKTLWEFFLGARFTSIYYTRQQGEYTSEEFFQSQNSAGDLQLVKLDDYNARVGVSEGGISFRGLGDLGFRSWFLQGGKAGFELSGGLSLSNLTPKEFRLKSHFIGLSYIRRWTKPKRTQN